MFVVDLQFKMQKLELNYIDKYSCLGLLGPQAKDIRTENNLFIWRVNKNNNFIILNNIKLNENHIQKINLLKPINFHYISQNNLTILKQNFSMLSKEKQISVIIKIDKLNFSGNKNERIRNYLNKYKYLEITSELKKSNDINELLNKWTETLAQKYFRNYAGKNKYFFKQNFHLNCECIFIYDQDKLVSFAVASPVENGYGSYILRKALTKEYPGLTEFTDVKIYEKLLNKYGPYEINLGQAGTKGMLYYKKKFPNSREQLHYNGKIKI